MMGAKEVAAGASWLDENFPGWEREIDLGTLNLGSCADCVCGQSLRFLVNDRLRTGFDAALELGVGSTAFIGPAVDWATTHGFYTRNGEWKELESLWRDLIKERFNTGNLSDMEEGG